MRLDREKIRVKLRKRMNREPKEHEVINSEHDYAIINEILMDELEQLRTRVEQLERGRV